MATTFISGLVYRGGRLDWTTLRQVGDKLQVAEHKEAALQVADTPPALPPPDLAPQIRAACSSVKGNLCLAVPTDQVLMRVVDLPTIDPAEMRGMVELQVDKFSPFPVEHMAVSCEVLEKQASSSRVLIVAVKREIVDGIGETFKKAGLYPHWMDVEVLSWWHLFKEKGEIPAHGRRIFILLDAFGTELIVSQNGIPVLFRSLGGRQGLSEEEFIEEVADEISYTLTSLEVEWGAVENIQMTLWQWGSGMPALAARLSGGRKAPGPAAAPAESLKPPKLDFDLEEPVVAAPPSEGLGLQVDQRQFDVLPPLSEGLARRAVGQGETMINLAPPEWRSVEKTRSIHKHLLVATAAVLVVWLLVVSFFVVGLKLQRKNRDRLKTAVEEIEGPAKEVERLQDKFESLNAYADRSHSALECLREVSALLPEGVDLNSFAYKKRGTVSLRGECATVGPIYDFFQALEKSELFDEVKAEPVSTKNVGAVQKSQFGVTMTLPGAKEQK